MTSLRFTSRVPTRRFFSLRTKPIHLPIADLAFAIPSHEVVDEERCPGYSPQIYYPARPGEILGDKYHLLAKIGWGSSSTVWLAQDLTRCGLLLVIDCMTAILFQANENFCIIRYQWQSERTVALKILNGRAGQSAREELDMERTIAQSNPAHIGYGTTRTFLDSFEVQNSENSHLCMVYEAMREPMSMFARRFENRRISLPIAKAYIHMLLLGLQYLHAECKVIHTGKVYLLPSPYFSDESVTNREARSRSEASKYPDDIRK